MPFKNKVVWITGASSGIGRGLAQAFAAAGARVVLSARRATELEAIRAQYPHPERHLVLPLDVTNASGFPELAARVEQEVGPVDILINNAGITQRSLVADTDMAVVRKIMETNFFGALALTKAVLPAMIARGQGHLVYTASLTAKFGTPLRSIYAASKHALMGFTDALRAEVWRSGVKVSVLVPGFVRTNATRNALTGDGSPHAVMDESTAKGITPERCAQAVLRGLALGKNEITISGKERIMVALRHIWPNLFHRIIRSIKVT